MRHLLILITLLVFVIIYSGCAATMHSPQSEIIALYNESTHKNNKTVFGAQEINTSGLEQHVTQTAKEKYANESEVSVSNGSQIGAGFSYINLVSPNIAFAFTFGDNLMGVDFTGSWYQKIYFTFALSISSIEIIIQRRWFNSKSLALTCGPYFKTNRFDVDWSEVLSLGSEAQIRISSYGIHTRAGLTIKGNEEHYYFLSGNFDQGYYPFYKSWFMSIGFNINFY